MTLRLAFRNVFRQKMRTLLTLAAIAFGVAGLILSGGFIEDIFVQLREATIHSRLGHLQVSREGFAAFGRRAPYQYVLPDADKLAADLRARPHVTDVLPRLGFAGLLGNGRANFSVVGEGVDPDKETALGNYVPGWLATKSVAQRAVTIVEGRPLSTKDVHGVLLGQGVAQAMKLRPGDTATILLNTPDGALNSLEAEVVGTFRTYSKDYDDRAVRIPLAAAQELLATRAVHSLVVVLDDTARTDAARADLGTFLEGRNVEIRTWLELADFYQKTVDLYRRQFGVLQFITLCMVLLTVANSVSMTIYERTGEVGTLMALGNRRNEVRKLIVVENLVLGLTGALLGVLLGIAGAHLLSRVGIPMPPPPNSEAGYVAYVRVVPVVVLQAALCGLAAAALAALLPAHRASRLPVVEALRHG